MRMYNSLYRSRNTADKGCDTAKLVSSSCNKFLLVAKAKTNCSMRIQTRFSVNSDGVGDKKKLESVFVRFQPEVRVQRNYSPDKTEKILGLFKTVSITKLQRIPGQPFETHRIIQMIRQLSSQFVSMATTSDHLTFLKARTTDRVYCQAMNEGEVLNGMIFITNSTNQHCSSQHVTQQNYSET